MKNIATLLTTKRPDNLHDFRQLLTFVITKPIDCYYYKIKSGTGFKLNILPPYFV